MSQFEISDGESEWPYHYHISHISLYRSQPSHDITKLSTPIHAKANKQRPITLTHQRRCFVVSGCIMKPTFCRPRVSMGEKLHPPASRFLPATKCGQARAGGLSLYGVQPCRTFDTRHLGSGLPFTGTLSPPVDVVDTRCAASSLAQAYVFNATVLPVSSLRYLTLWPDGENQPVVSTLNAGTDPSPTTWQSCPPATEKLTPMQMGSRN